MVKLSEVSLSTELPRVDAGRLATSVRVSVLRLHQPLLHLNSTLSRLLPFASLALHDVTARLCKAYDKSLLTLSVFQAQNGIRGSYICLYIL